MSVLSPVPTHIRAAAPVKSTWFADSQKEALTRYQSLPTPTRKDENWRFGNLQRLEDLAEMPVAAPFSREEKAQALELSVSPLENSSAKLVFGNGELLNPEALATLPIGLQMLPLAEAAQQWPELLQEYFMARVTNLGSAKYAALHQARTGAGVVLKWAPGAQQDHAVEIWHWINGNGTIFPHALLIAGENSRGSVLEHHRSLSPGGAIIAVSDLVAHHGSHLNYAVAQQTSAETLVLHMNTATVQRDATATMLQMNLGGKWARNENLARMENTGAASIMLSLSTPAGSCEVDQRTFQHHISPRATSDLLYKNVLHDEAKTVFAGLISVDKGAHYTDAYQTCRTLLLSDSAEAHSMPGLEINADQVKCSHGATSGQISEEELFYLLARGIAAEEARRLIALGFAAQVLERMPDTTLAAACRLLLERSFGISQGEIGILPLG